MVRFSETLPPPVLLTILVRPFVPPKSVGMLDAYFVLPNVLLVVYTCKVVAIFFAHATPFSSEDVPTNIYVTSEPTGMFHTGTSSRVGYPLNSE